MHAEVLYPSKCILGEGPLWHEGRKCCYWVDIEGCTLYEFDWITHQTRTWKFDGKVSLVVKGTGNQLILTLDSSLIRFDPKSAQIQKIIDVENISLGNRCNDGSVDSSGRLWVGTMSAQHEKEKGALYCVDTDLKIRKKLTNVSISNGIAWSLDNKRLYYIDSPTQVVQSFLFDETSGEIMFEKNIVNIPAEMGSPDGMAIDEEGMLWIAHWGGFGVYRWDPRNGKLLSKIELPVPQVSSCAFVGDDLDYLLITTARENFSEKDINQYPQSGDVFLAKVNTRGTLSFQCLI